MRKTNGDIVLYSESRKLLDENKSEYNMIVPVDETNLYSAAEIHSISWKESHSGFCSEQFVALHTVERQMDYLKAEMLNGNRLFMLIERAPVGIVSVKDSLIGNLYVLPTEQRKGYGTALLEFAIGECPATPHLWMLDNNQRANNFYSKHGFKPSGNRHVLSDLLAEVELILPPSV